MSSSVEQSETNTKRMETQSSQQQSIDEILQKLSTIVMFTSNLKHPPVHDYPEFDGEFRDKLQSVLHTRKKKAPDNIVFDTFVWKRCEVGQLTGNQLLRALVALCRSQVLRTGGSCIILTINGEPDHAVFSINSEWLENVAPSPVDDEKRRYYDKIFDEKKSCFMQTKPGHEQHFSDEKLSAIRDQVPDRLQAFLHNQIAESNPEFRHAFMGMLQELVKSEYRTIPVSDIRIKIPVASCIWLAIHHSMSHKLQAMFGNHWLPIKDWRSQWTEQYPNITNAEIERRTNYKKAMLRSNAVKVIILSTIQIDRNGSYNTEKVKEVVDKVKAFYQITAEY